MLRCGCADEDIVEFETFARRKLNDVYLWTVRKCVVMFNSVTNICFKRV